MLSLIGVRVSVRQSVIKVRTEREGERERESLSLKMLSIKNTLIADQKLKLEVSGAAAVEWSGVQSFISSSAPLIDFFNSRAGTSTTSY